MNLWQSNNLLFEGKWETGGFWLYSVRLWSRVMIRTLFCFVWRLNSEKVTRNSTPSYVETWLRLSSTPSTQLWAGLVRGSAQGVPAGVAPRTCTQVALCVCAEWVCVCLPAWCTWAGFIHSSHSLIHCTRRNSGGVFMSSLSRRLQLEQQLI